MILFMGKKLGFRYGQFTIPGSAVLHAGMKPTPIWSQPSMYEGLD
jgi:hypothetical protein